MNILQLAQRFKDWLLKRESRAQAQMLTAYEAAWTRISAEIERLTAEIEQQGGGTGKLFEQERLRAIQDALAQEIVKLAEQASRRTRGEQARVIGAARDHAMRMMERAASDAGVRVRLAGLPKGALEHLVGMAQDGSPLDDLFKQLARDMGAESKDVLKNALIQSVAMGQNPRQAAAYVRRQVDAKGDNPQRDPRIVRKLNSTYRQSVFTSAREANRESYKANSRVVRKWRWLATHDAHTCVVCWAMDGQEFDVDTPFASHINCRCTTVPVIEGDPKPETGPEAFAKLEPGFQKQILGESAYQAYKEGRVRLQDFVGERHSDRWGASLYRRGLADILKDEKPWPDPANVEVHYGDGAKEIIGNLFGRELTDVELSKAVGALDGATVRVESRGERLFAQVLHPDIERQDVFIQRDDADGLFIYNDDIRTRANAPQGTGLQLIATQVAGAQEAGVQYLALNAAGRPGSRLIGYYVWPRLGYNAALSAEEIGSLPEELKAARDLNDLMLLGGQDWWRENGSERDAAFDLGDGSRSLSVLRRYLRGKGFRVRF
jgi:SPP1 gp7 family putative phage head morphogenesis protein